MKIWPSILVGIVLGLGPTMPASAADLGAGDWSMKDGPHSRPWQARWYIRGDLGYAMHDEGEIPDTDFIESIDSELDDTWTVGGGVGLYFSSNIRGDLTIDYRNDAELGGVFPWSVVGAGTFDMDLSSTVVLANLYYDFGRHDGFSPYIGVGLGWSNNQLHDGRIETVCGCVYAISGETETDVAAAFMAGATIDLSREEMGGSVKDMGGDGMISTPHHRGLKLDVGYRYLHLGDASTGSVLDNDDLAVADGLVVEDISAHEFRIGLRYDIW